MPHREKGMFKWGLISVVIVPVLAGMQAATSRRGQHSLPLLIVFLLIYDVLYFLLLYYLRVRWI